MKMRLQKFLNSSGVASRRKSEEYIKNGLVAINGNTATLGTLVDPDVDEIFFQGERVLKTRDKLYLALYKPRGYVSSRKDPQGRKTVYDLLPSHLKKKVWYVGRLDYDTEGLMLFTNDGELTQKFSHPKHEHEKEYVVSLSQAATKEQLERLRKGVRIDSGTTLPAAVRYEKGVVFITLKEGKNRQIRKSFQAVSLKIKNLKRIRIGNIKLPSGKKQGQFWQLQKKDLDSKILT